MKNKQKVKLVRIGNYQVVRIPKKFELPFEDATMRKEGSKLIIEPVRRESLLDVLKKLSPLDEDFPEIADPPPSS